MKWVISLNLVIDSFDKFRMYPVNAGAPSVVMRASLLRHNCNFSKECVTLSNMSTFVVVPLRLYG